MQKLSVEQILKWIENLKNLREPVEIDLKKPDYMLYGIAPNLSPEQAACLLAGLTVIDRDTFTTLISLTPLQLQINYALQAAQSLRSADSMGNEETYAQFLIYRFPIPHDSLYYLKNIYECIKKYIENGALKSTSFKEKNITSKLLNPKDVIQFAKDQKIDLNEALLDSISYREGLNLLRLPKTFPDTINFIRLFNKLKIENNLKKPLSLSLYKNTTSCENYQSNVENSLQTLNKEELELPISSLIYCIACSPRANYLNKEGIHQFKKALQRLAPCPQTVFQQTTWSVEDAALIYYSIDPQFSQTLTHSVSDPFWQIYETLSLLDKEDKVFHNFNNYLAAKYNKNIPSQVHINVFIEFLTEKKYLIPKHFPISSQNLSELNKSTAAIENPEKDLSAISEKGQNLYQSAIRSRRKVIDWALIQKFSNQQERSEHLYLIEKFAYPKIKNFNDYSEKGRNPDNDDQYACQALAKFILHFEPKLTKSRIKHHELMKTYFQTTISKLSQKTFNDWLSNDGIYQRKR